MRATAILTMFLAWLLYGAMPALGACPMCDQAMAHTDIAEMDMPAMPTMTMPSPAGHHEDGGMQENCVTHIAFCAFCLVIPPAAALADQSRAVFSYPAPALSTPLRDARPAPASPPPRLV